MEKKKLTTLLIIGLMMLLMSVTMAQGAFRAYNASTVTIVRPASTTIYQGVQSAETLNFTCVGTNSSKLYNITWWARSAGTTANTSWKIINTSVLRNLTNCSAAQMNNTYLNFRFNSSAGYRFQDGADYQFQVMVKCASYKTSSTQNSTNATAISGVEIDYGVPTAPSAVAPASGSKWNLSDNVNINVTVTNADASANCRLTWVGTTPTGNPTDTMTYTATTCRINLTGMPDGTYHYYVQAYDGTNYSVESTEWNLRVDTGQSSPMAKGYAYDYSRGLFGTEGITSKNLALLAVVGVLIYVFVKRNKN